MNVVETQTRTIEITGAARLDPIKVFLNDVGPGAGHITITCYGQSWSGYWGGMGDRSLAKFFVACDEHYIAGKISNTKSSVFDPDGLKAMMKKLVIQQLRSREIKPGEARELYDQINDLETFDQCPWHESDLMQRVIGDDWHLAMPEKVNPDYEYLCRIIRAVQEALRTMP